MNRQQRRSRAQSEPVDGGGVDEAALADEPAPVTTVPERKSTATAAAPSPAGVRRATPRQFLHEVNVEMRKVVWPSRAETANYSTVVLITLAVLMALIFLLDLAFTKLAGYIFT